MPRTCPSRTSTRNSWRWRHLVRSWSVETSPVRIPSMNSSRRKTAWARKCSSMSWRYGSADSEGMSETCQLHNLYRMHPITVASGVFSGWPGGGLLSRERIHCRTPPHAGDDPHLNTCTQTDWSPAPSWALDVFTDCVLFYFLDAGRGGFLCVCEVDARLQTTRAVQTQHGWAGALHVPVWVYDPGKSLLLDNEPVMLAECRVRW